MTYGRSHFEPFVGEGFVVPVVQTPDGTYRADGVAEAEMLVLTLVEVRSLPPGNYSGWSEETAFTLTFRAGGELPQATYTLRRAGLEDMDVFLMARGFDADGFLLQAIFN